jgi:hypothetical protein
MWRPTAMRITFLSMACALLCAAAFATGGHKGRASYSGGHSHGGGSHGGGSRGGGHSSGSKNRGGFRGGGARWNGGGRHGSFSSGSSAFRQRSHGSYRAPGRAPGSFPSRQPANPGYFRGGGAGTSRPAVGGTNSGAWYGRNAVSGRGNTARSASPFFGPNRPPSSQRGFSESSGRSGSGSTDTSGRRAAWNSSFSPNRPPGSQRNDSNRYARGDRGSGRVSPRGRVISTDPNRPGTQATAANWSSASRNVSGPGNDLRRRAPFGSDRPSDARSTLARFTNRGNSAGSHFAGDRAGSRTGSRRLAGSPSFGFERTSFGHRGGYGGLGYGQRRFDHDGFGGAFRHGGYGHFGDRGGYGGDDLWILGDVFGLALDFTRLALSPWAYLGWNVLDTGVTALGNFDNYNQPSSYHPPLCGNDYSDENPGCLQ